MEFTDIYDYGQQTKLYPVKVNPNFYAIMRNDFIKGSQGDGSIKIAKFLRLMVSQVVKYDKQFKTYTIGINDLAAFWDIDISNIYREVEKYCEQLVQATIKLKKGDGVKGKWSVFHWVSRADYENGEITFRFSDEIKSYIIGLNEFYTQYQIEEIQKFKSLYSLRLYELLKCDCGLNYDNKESYTYSIDELREFFECTNKYKTTAVFLLKTVDKAMEEINEKTSLEINAEYKKEMTKGNPITSVIFYPIWHQSLERKKQYLTYLEYRNSGKTNKKFSEWKMEYFKQ